jgi:hypothetical protein
MSYILIVLILSHPKEVTLQEFNNKESCEVAAKLIREELGTWTNNKTACVPK